MASYGFDLRAEGIDRTAIAALVQARVEARRAAGEGREYLPSFVHAAALLEPNRRSPAGMYLARLQNPTLAVAPQVVPSGVPIVGRLLDRFREELHRLVIFYLNQIAARQSAYNVDLVQAVRTLEAECADLHARLSQVERGERGV